MKKATPGRHIPNLKNTRPNISQEEKAKLELHQCSLQSEFDEYLHINSPRAKLSDFQNYPKHNQSLRSTEANPHSTQGTTYEINLNKKNKVSSRYMIVHQIKQNCNGKKPQTKNRAMKIQKVSMATAELSFNYDNNTETLDTHQNCQERTARSHLHKSFRKSANNYQRIHTYRKIINDPCYELSYRASPSSRPTTRQATYFNFNQTFCNYKKANKPSESMNQTSRSKSQHSRNGAKSNLRPELIRLVQRIKGKQNDQSQKNKAESQSSRIHTTQY